MASTETSLQDLDSIVQTASAFVVQLQTVLDEIHKSAAPSSTTLNTTAEASQDPNVDALALARDAASLIKAHSTKISLLIINKPFTASAVTTVVRELVAGPIPGIASAAQSCDPDRYTNLLRRELAWCARRVLAGLHELLLLIPKDGKVLPQDKHKGFSADAKGSITTTGVLWSACDDVVNLSNGGVAGFMLKQVEGWRDTLKDVMEELKEWSEEEPDDDDDESDAGTDGEDAGVTNSHTATQDMLDELMDSHRAIPRSDPENIRPRLNTSLTRIRLVILLYQAIVKRRIKKLPAIPSDTASTHKVPQRLDEAASLLRKIPDQFGDLACAFYELDVVEIDKAMDQCFFDAFAASELLNKDWEGARDVFSEWTDKFRTEIKKE